MSVVIKLHKSLGDELKDSLDQLKPELSLVIAMKDGEVFVHALQDMPVLALVGMLEIAKVHFIEESSNE